MNKPGRPPITRYILQSLPWFHWGDNGTLGKRQSIYNPIGRRSCISLRIMV
jgi:hypothetical protein